MASEYTKNYSFDLYTDNDKPNLRDQYNGAIIKIDKQLHANATAISNNATAISNNATAIADETTRAKAAEQALQTNIDAEKTRAENAEQALQTNIDAAKAAADAAQNDIDTLLPKTDFNTENTVKKYIDDNVNTLNARIDTNVVYFDTVADMQAFTNFKNGMMCRTKGFYNADDMGGAYYSISDTGIVNGMDIIQCGEYVATLIKSEFVSVAQLGAMGNGTNNDASFILRALEISDSISFSEKTYFINSDITINNKTVYLNDGEIFSHNKTIIVENQSEICCGTLNGTNIITRDTKNHVHDILIKDWIGTALTVDGYENFISHIRLENDNNDETVGVEIVKADNTISFIYGYGAHTGIKVNSPDSYIDNVHLWLNGNNKFTDSKFVDVSSTLVSFTNCCCDSYETFANITADYLLIKFVNCYWITNSDIFKNKSYVIFKCTDIHNYNISGNISCRLVGMANAASTLNFGSVANVNIDAIDGDLENAPIAQYQAYTLQNNSEYLFRRDGYISAQVWNEDSYVDVLFIAYSGDTYNTSHITKNIKGSLIFVPEGTKIKVTISGSNAEVKAGIILGYAMPS